MRTPLWIVVTGTVGMALPVAASAQDRGAEMKPPEAEVCEIDDGRLELTARAGFKGGCCYTLTTRNVTAALDLPEGISVVSGPEPEAYDTIVGPEGRAKEGVAEFRWVLEKIDPEPSPPITVHIKTANSGQMQTQVPVGKTEGARPCKVSALEVPRPAPAGRPIPASVEVRSNREGRYVDSVTIYHVTDGPAGALDASAERGVASWTGTDGAAEATGQPVAMERTEGSATWSAQLPKHEQGGVACWVVAEDSEGEFTTGKVETVPVVGSVASWRVGKAAPFGLAVCAAAILSLGFWRRRKIMRVSAGVLPIGSKVPLGDPPAIQSDASAGEAVEARQARIAALLLAIALVLLLAAGLFGGQFAELIAHWSGARP